MPVFGPSATRRLTSTRMPGWPSVPWSTAHAAARRVPWPAVNAKRVGGAALPGVGTGRLHAAAAQQLPPVVVLEDAGHAVAPAVGVLRLDQVGLGADRLHQCPRRRGQHGAATGE